MIFKDTNGDAWDIRLNIGIIQEIDNVIPDFSTIVVKDAEKLLHMLWQDTEKVVQILWVLCEDQAKERNITPKQFARLLDRDVLNSATDCLLTEFVSFFQYGPVGKKVREAMPMLLEKAKTKLRTIAEKEMREASSKLDTLLPES